MDDRPRQEPPPERPEGFLTKDRAKRFVYRLDQVRRERSSFYKAAAIGMTSFAQAAPALLGIEEDMTTTVDAVLAGRLRDRERGETEIPFVVALEGALERTRRARVLEQARGARRVAADAAQPRILALLADAMRRLDAFVAVYDAERFLALPASTEVARVLAQVEEDAALDHLPAVPTARPGLAGPAVDGRIPRLVTAADAFEDVLRAARAEVPGAPPPWRATKAGAEAPLVFALGVPIDAAAAAPPASLLGPGPAAARTARAVEVARFAHPIEVTRAHDADGEVVGIAIAVADTSGVAVARAVAPGVALPPADDAAVRAYLLAAQKAPDPLAPARLVATMGLFQAVDRALERTLRPVVSSGAAALVAKAVPREASRKAPVRREVAAALADAIPGLPVQRATDVLDAVAQGKVAAAMLRPPDVGLLLAVLGRAWPGNRPFGEPILAPGAWSDDDAVAAAKAAVLLARVRVDLERQRDPGAGWTALVETAAIQLLTLLARVRAR